MRPRATTTSLAAPVDVKVFGAYFPLASRYSLDVPALWHWHGLKEIWEEAYAEIPGVTWLSTGAWDPCNFGTTKPIESLADLQGPAGLHLPDRRPVPVRFGVVPVSLPYEDVEPAIQTGELDGVCWCGITEVHTVGWADVLKYYLTNPLSGAWAGSYFVNTDKWNAVPEHLQQLFKLAMDSSHYYRQHWYWAGEAKYRTPKASSNCTTIPDAEWKTVEDEAFKFWDEIATQSPRSAKVVEIIKKYNAIDDEGWRALPLRLICPTAFESRPGRHLPAGIYPTKSACRCDGRADGRQSDIRPVEEGSRGGDIDTVLVCAVDMQGRLIGKRFLARYFVESAYDETHGCNYLLANDIDMEPVPGYKAASWSKGYGDFVMKPDLSTIRNVPWLEKTALVLCDVLDHHTHEDLPHSPRAILKRQVKRLQERG